MAPSPPEATSLLGSPAVRALIVGAGGAMGAALFSAFVGDGTGTALVVLGGAVGSSLTSLVIFLSPSPAAERLARWAENLVDNPSTPVPEGLPGPYAGVARHLSTLAQRAHAKGASSSG